MPLNRIILSTYCLLSSVMCISLGHKIQKLFNQQNTKKESWEKRFDREKNYFDEGFAFEKKLASSVKGKMRSKYMCMSAQKVVASVSTE